MSNHEMLRCGDISYYKQGMGPAILLVHGFPANGSLWDTVANELASSYTVIVPDLPGSGNSPLKKPSSLADMAVMLRAVLEQEHLGKAVIAGHSMGGYIGLAFAHLYPAMLCGLSLVHSTAEADDDDKKEKRRQAISLLQQGAKTQFISQMVPNLFSPSFKQSAPGAVQQQISSSLTVDDQGMINFYEAMITRPGTTEVLEHATFPVQWICGYDDTVIPYKKNLRQCHISGVNFVSFYHNCGHMSMLEAPERLTDDLRKFTDHSYDALH